MQNGADETEEGRGADIACYKAGIRIKATQVIMKNNSSCDTEASVTNLFTPEARVATWDLVVAYSIVI